MSSSDLASWQNTLKSAMDPSKARIMIGKVIRRFTDTQGSLSGQENAKWLSRNARDLGAWMGAIDPALSTEMDVFLARLKSHAQTVLSTIPYNLGGGGGVPLLYALVRMRKPKVIVETGVASGFSSATFLAALKENGDGRLFSSDFPYFRIPEPEKYIGVVVEPHLKDRWNLLIKGDEVNLPAIVREAGAIDLFHYDSDKSYDGRAMAMKVIVPALSENALVIMDDIQDNSFFHDYVTKNAPKHWSVFSYEGKYIGVIGNIG